MRAAVIGVAVLLAGCESSDLNRCDKEIQATLKSPASYKRVTAKPIDDYKYRISYDAVNSFNAPIRYQGTCWVIGEDATWFQDLETR